MDKVQLAGDISGHQQVQDRTSVEETQITTPTFYQDSTTSPMWSTQQPAQAPQTFDQGHHEPNQDFNLPKSQTTIVDEAIYFAALKMASSQALAEKRSRILSSNMENNHDDDEEDFSLLNSRISQLLIKDGVIPSSQPCLIQKSAEVASNDANNGSPSLQSPTNFGRRSDIRQEFGMTLNNCMPSEDNRVIPNKFSADYNESNFVCNFAEIQQIKRPQGNSKSLVNGKNPQHMRVQDYSSELQYQAIQVMSGEECGGSSSLNPKSQHQMSGDIHPPCWEANSSDDEINFKQTRIEENKCQQNSNSQSENFKLTQVSNQPQDSSSIFARCNGPLSYKNGYHLESGAFSHNEIYDKQSHQSWEEEGSCGTLSNGYMHINPGVSKRINSAAGDGMNNHISNAQFSPNYFVNNYTLANAPDHQVVNMQVNNNYNGSSADSEPYTQYEGSSNQYDQNPYSLFSSPPNTQNKFYNRSGSGLGSNQTGYPPINQILTMQSQPGGARANSFDKVAKQQQVDLHQNYFGNSSFALNGEPGKGYVKTPSQDLDQFSTKSMGQVSSFSDGAIFNSHGQLQNSVQPGGKGMSLGQLRTFYDSQGNIKIVQQPNSNETLVQQSQHAYGFYDPHRQQFSNQILNSQQPYNNQVHQTTFNVQQFQATPQRQQVHYNGNMHLQYNGQSQTNFSHPQNQESLMLPNQYSNGYNLQQNRVNNSAQLRVENLSNQFDNQVSFSGYPSLQNNPAGTGSKKIYINGVRVTNYSQQQELIGGSNFGPQSTMPPQFKPQFDQNQQGYQQQFTYQQQQHPMSNNNSSMQMPSYHKVSNSGGYRIDQQAQISNNNQQYDQHQNAQKIQSSNSQYLINSSGMQQIPMMEGPINIGKAAPAKIMRNIDFNHEAQNLFNNHHGPMIALQQNIQNLDQHLQSQQPRQTGFNPYQSQSFHPQKQTKPPLSRGGANSVTTASSHGDKDTSYMKQVGGGHIMFIPQQLNHHLPTRSLSGVATPSQQNNSIIPHNYNVKSNNSSSFSGEVLSGGNSENGCGSNILNFSQDQNEKLLRQIIHQYEECQSQDQKFDIIRGNIHRLALEQTGSRFLQKQLNKSNSAIVQFFLSEIEEHFADLMIDNYGNYFCQKLLQNCSSDQRLTILRVIQYDFIKICCNKRGTHTIQFMFDLINRPAEESLITQALQGHIVELSQDFQGTHVVQKVLCTFSEETKRQFIYDEVYESFMAVAKNTNGICVVKKLIQIYSPASINSNPEAASNQEQKKINSAKLLKKIQDNVIDLVQDPFGNYIVQEIIKIWDQSVCRPIFEAIKSKICTLSNQKFSSNVIELCLNMADEELLSDFIHQIRITDKLANLVRNQYGNYVVQSALKVCQGQQLTDLIKAIAQRLPEVTDRKIRGKWEQILHEAAIGNFGRGTKRVEMHDTNSQMSSPPSDHHQNISPQQNQSPFNNQGSQRMQDPQDQPQNDSRSNKGNQNGGQSHKKPPKGKKNNQKQQNNQQNQNEGARQNQQPNNSSNSTAPTTNSSSNNNRQQQQQSVEKQNQQVQQQQQNHQRDSKGSK